MILLLVTQNGYGLRKGHIISLIIWQQLKERVGANFTTWKNNHVRKLGNPIKNK